MNINFIAKFKFIGKLFAKICKKIKWIVGFLVPLLFMHAAVAGEKLTEFSFKPTPEDISVSFLKKIFGTVGGVLVGTGTTVMGQIFYVFNCGILVVIGSVLFYTISKSIVEIAHGDPSQMGRKFNWWMPARVVMGIGMIVPNSAGYSFLNVVVMWMVLQGIGLADSIWSQVVNYIGEGGALYTYVGRSTQGTVLPIDMIDYTLIRGGERNGQKVSGSSDFMRSQLCMYALQRVLTRSQELQNEKINASPGEYSDDIKRAFKANYPALRESYDDTTKTIYFPGNAQESLPYPGQSKTQDLNGICGAYSWGGAPALQDESDKGGPKQYEDAKKAGITSMAVILKNSAQPAINDYDIKTGETKAQKFSEGTDKSAYTDIVSSAAAYQSLIREARVYAGHHYKTPEDIRPATEWTKELAKEMTKGGWISAGTYYFKLAKIGERERAGEPPDFMNYAPVTVTSGPRCDLPLDFDPKKDDAALKCGVNPEFQSILARFDAYLSGRADDFKVLLKDRLSWYAEDGGQSVADVSGADGGSSIYNAALVLATHLNEQMVISAQEGRIPSLSAALTRFSPASSSQTIVNIRTRSSSGLFQSGLNLVLNPLNTMLSNIGKEWYSEFAAPTTSVALPLINLQKLGSRMINESYDFWMNVINFVESYVTKWYFATAGLSAGVALLSFVGALGFGTGSQQALMGLIQFAQVTVKVFLEIPMMIVLPLGFAVSTLVLVNGVLLYFYLPLVPFMLFLFGVISWISFVIEGMVATPLVALGLTHPEGHDLLGKADQALMLLVAMFIRPTALIIGLVSGIVLSFVAIDVLNAGFGILVSELFPLSGTVQSINASGAAAPATVQSFNALDQTTTMALLMAYTLIVISLMQQCFSLINVIPARITRWIGISGEMGPEAQLAEAVKTGLSGAAERAGGAIQPKPESVAAVLPEKPKSRDDGGGGGPAGLEGGGGGEEAAKLAV